MPRLVLTDDKKARRIAEELGVNVVSTKEVLKQWSEITHPDISKLRATLAAIERFANYRPGRSLLHYEWWMAALITGGK